MDEEQPRLGVIIEPSILQLKERVSVECGAWDGPLETRLVKMKELMKFSWCPHSNAGVK